MLSIADPVISCARSFFCLASSSGGSTRGEGVEGALEAGAGVEQRRLDVVGVGDRQALADVWGQHLAQDVGDVDDTDDHLRVVEDAADHRRRG